VIPLSSIIELNVVSLDELISVLCTIDSGREKYTSILPHTILLIKTSFGSTPCSFAISFLRHSSISFSQFYRKENSLS
jgi:hypothetical protein